MSLPAVTESRGLSGADKAAVLLLYMGPEATTKIFEHLEDAEIKKIGQSMTMLGYVSRPSIEQVVDEFNELTNPDTGISPRGKSLSARCWKRRWGHRRRRSFSRSFCQPAMAT
jgi:flagellar motor switch protein FliG